MSFFAILFALLIEQVRPLNEGNPVHHTVRAWARWVSRNVDAGQTPHGWLAWTIAVMLPAAAAMGVHWLLVFSLGWTGTALAFVFHAAVLYITLGFRQFSHHFTAIRDALDAGDEGAARQALARWKQVDASDLPKNEIVRHVIEHSVLAAHRHVFGVLGWYALLAAFGFGPAGAVLYRLSEFAQRYYSHRWLAGDSQPVYRVSSALLSASRTAWRVVDYVPARVTSLGFAIVGNFEEAIDCWRNFAERLGRDTLDAGLNENDGVILAATSGAVNVRLGGEGLKEVFSPLSSQTFQSDNQAASPNAATGTTDYSLNATSAQPAQSTEFTAPASETITPGREPQLLHLRSVVGLVWRSVVLWMLLLALLSLARLLG